MQAMGYLLITVFKGTGIKREVLLYIPLNPNYK